MANMSLAAGWRKYAWAGGGYRTRAVRYEQPEWSIPLAGRLFSIGLMRFIRSSGVLAGFVCVVLSSSAVTVVQVAAAGRLDVLSILLGCLISNVVLSVPLLADRLLFRRLNPFPATLVFPCSTRTWG